MEENKDTSSYKIRRVKKPQNLQFMKPQEIVDQKLVDSKEYGISVSER